METWPDTWPALHHGCAQTRQREDPEGYTPNWGVGLRRGRSLPLAAHAILYSVLTPFKTSPQGTEVFAWSIALVVPIVRVGKSHKYVW